MRENALTGPVWVLSPPVMDKFGTLVQRQQPPRTNTQLARREWSDHFFVQPSNTVLAADAPDGGYPQYESVCDL